MSQSAAAADALEADVRSDFRPGNAHHLEVYSILHLIDGSIQVVLLSDVSVFLAGYLTPPYTAARPTPYTA